MWLLMWLFACMFVGFGCVDLLSVLIVRLVGG